MNQMKKVRVGFIFYIEFNYKSPDYNLSTHHLFK